MRETIENQEGKFTYLHDLVLRAFGNPQLDKEVTKFANGLRSKYPDCENYLLFHVLIASTPPPCKNFDFPGDDSVEQFLERFARSAEREAAA